jgi:hypothetical protein
MTPVLSTEPTYRSTTPDVMTMTTMGRPTLTMTTPDAHTMGGALQLARALRYAPLRDEPECARRADIVETVAVKVGDRNDFPSVSGRTHIGVYRGVVTVEVSSRARFGCPALRHACGIPCRATVLLLRHARSGPRTRRPGQLRPLVDRIGVLR